MADAAKVFLAADLGASSGRVVAGLFDGGKLSLEEVYRFDNGGVQLAGRMQWDLLSQWDHIQRGLRAGGKVYSGQVASIGVDTWGVDFGLVGRNDELLGNPYHYRDPRTADIFDKAFAIVPREEIFRETGLQFMEFNTLYQLLAMKLTNSPLLDVAESFLMMPDLFHWLLTGEKGNEYTDASTTQFYNPKTKAWATGLLKKFGIPTHIFGPLLQPGTKLGPLRKEIGEESGLVGVPVVLPGTHDTASAVMSVPAASRSGEKPNWCYISSGTWSLMGVETPEPIISDRCYQLNFTNEGGVGGTTRVLKNIAGLWLVQECRRVWKLDGHEHGWEELIQRAGKAEPLVSLINPDDASFTAPKDMPAAIRDFCARTNQPVPESEGAVIRCALESLALRYRMVLGFLEELVGGPLETIHIVGGGAQNRLLNRMAAEACNRPVVAGPVEATAIGNVMMQAVASGAVGSIAQAREVIKTSFQVQEFAPKHPAAWNEAYERFKKLLE
jgi:rhamnulokinase